MNRLADDSHEISRLVFFEKKKNNNNNNNNNKNKCRLLQILLGALRVNIHAMV